MTENSENAALPQIGRRQFIAAGAVGATVIAVPGIAAPEQYLKNWSTTIPSTNRKINASSS